MFEDRSDFVAADGAFPGYGAAVTPGPDGPRVFVAGYDDANRLLTWRDGRLVDVACGIVADEHNHALGVAAADIDADGQEEVYVHNADTFGGVGGEPDLLFDRRDGRWIDLFATPVNRGRENFRVGRSVAAVDRLGTGRYGLFVTGYGAPPRFYEVGGDGEVSDLAETLGLDFVAGGRTLLPAPLVSDRMDVYVGNEQGPNFLLRNDAGHFTDVASEYGVTDTHEHARGVTVVDAGRQFDIACANWEGPSRLFRRDGRGFTDGAPETFADPTRARTLVAADFDNDGATELFVNVIGAPNRLFRVTADSVTALSPGDAIDPDGFGTGAAVADLDGDGTLELLVVHGEFGSQPLSLFSAPNDNDWLRLRPTTEHGAPARGATVTLETDAGVQTRLVDAGSGYLCQMEPVAHFGLGAATPRRATVRWPDGRETAVTDLDARTERTVPHPSA